MKSSVLSFPCSGKRAFTLVELLVVISVISVLVAMLLPALQNARTVARTTLCINNLKQSGIGVLAYARESRGWMIATDARSDGVDPKFYRYAKCWADQLMDCGVMPDIGYPEIRNSDSTTHPDYIAPPDGNKPRGMLRDRKLPKENPFCCPSWAPTTSYKPNKVEYQAGEMSTAITYGMRFHHFKYKNEYGKWVCLDGRTNLDNADWTIGSDFIVGRTIKLQNLNLRLPFLGDSYDKAKKRPDVKFSVSSGNDQVLHGRHHGRAGCWFPDGSSKAMNKFQLLIVDDSEWAQGFSPSATQIFLLTE